MQFFFELFVRKKENGTLQIGRMTHHPVKLKLFLVIFSEVDPNIRSRIGGLMDWLMGCVKVGGGWWRRKAIGVGAN